MTKPVPRPTDAELAILRVLWERGPSTVRQVHDVLSRERSAAADSQLMAIQRFPGSPVAGARTRQLAALLNDYDAPMPAAQRLFLMNDLHCHAGSCHQWPTLAARRVASNLSRLLRPNCTMPVPG